MGERESVRERERQGRKKNISNTKKFMEFYLVVLQSGYHMFIINTVIRGAHDNVRTCVIS